MHTVKKCVQLVCMALLLGGFSMAQAGEKVAPSEQLDHQLINELSQELGVELVPAEELDVELSDLELQDLEGSMSFSEVRTRDRLRERERCRRTGRCVPPRPQPRRGHLCYAVNEFNHYFEGFDPYSARWAQDLALRTCYRYSRLCRPAGCRRY